MFFTIIRLLIVPVTSKVYDLILYFNSKRYEETFIREFSALSNRNSTKLFVGYIIPQNIPLEAKLELSTSFGFILFLL